MSKTIYDLDYKGMRDALHDFQKTLYGRTVFFFAYFIPLVLFASSAMICVLAVTSQAADLACISGLIFCGFVLSFILANIYFYSELRKFVAHKK